MVFSKYSFLFLSENYGYLLYNSLSNAFFKIEKLLFEKIQKLQNDNTTIDELDSKTIKFLVDNKIIVESDRDEFNNMKLKIHYMRYNYSQFTYTILPTTDCNFGCSYCFEKNKQSNYMNEDIENRVVEFITNNHKINSLHITWMGGEPLLNFDSMKSITQKLLINKTIESYSATLITNGYLLSEKIISELTNLKINIIQITFDGMRQTHNKRRFHKSEGATFDIIINNIKNLIKLIPNIYIPIRINIDSNNMDEYNTIFDYLSLNIKCNNYSIYPGFIDGVNSCKSECTINGSHKVNFMKNQFKKNNKSIILYPESSTIECSIRNINSYVIGPSGELYKCWNDIDNKDKIIGDIYKKRDVNHKLLTNYLTGADPLDDPKCQDCAFFSLCRGGCPYNRLNPTSNDPTENCTILKNNLKEFLEFHFEMLIKNNFVNLKQKIV